MKKLIGLFILALGLSYGQGVNLPPRVIFVVSAPSGACTGSQALQKTITAGHLYSCLGGTWGDITGNGSGLGTVTSVSFTGGLISVADPTAAAALTVAGTSGGVVCFTSSSVWASSGALASGAVVVGGGAGACPTATTTPTFTGTNVTGLPISTGVSGLGAGVATFLATPSSANLASAVTGETGSGALVFGTSPTLVTPALGTPTALVLTNATGLPEAGLAFTDITTANASTSAHGLLRKLDNDANHFLNGQGGWTTPAGGGSGCTISGTQFEIVVVDMAGTGCDNSGVTIDASNNISTPGILSTGVGGSVAGANGLGQGTATTAPSGIVGFMAPASVTTPYFMILPEAPSTGFMLNTGTADPSTITFVGSSGSGNVVRVTSATLVTPTLGAALATSINGLTLTSSTGTFTLSNGKTFAVTHGLTLSGTDSTVMTFPSTSATIARTDAANTFTGTQTIGALVATTINGNTFTTGTGTLTIAAGKTLTASNSITFAGTDSTTMTFPSTSSTIPKVVASGAKALATAAISSGACTSAQTDTATGTASTDTIMADFNADPTGVTGYSPSANGGLFIVKYPTTDTVNFKVCNDTASSITPGAITLNWRVVR